MTDKMKRVKHATQLFLSMGYTRGEVARMYRSTRAHERVLRWMENGGFLSNRLNVDKSVKL